LPVPHEEPQSHVGGAASPDSAKSRVAAHFHGFGTKVHADRLSFAEPHFEPRLPERRFHDGNRQPDAESE
jgi:hypothetical protein